ncbi:MAG: STAS domain-containing protein [Bacillota bacterium]|nr:STAS domain-containing protein [Bacillota bacterium]
MFVTPMEIRESFDGRQVILRLEGEMDLHTAPLFRDRLEAAVARYGVTRVLADLSQVSFIDSSGLGALLGRHRALRERGGALRLLAPGGRVRSILELAGLTRALEVLEAPPVGPGRDGVQAGGR